MFWNDYIVLMLHYLLLFADARWRGRRRVHAHSTLRQQDALGSEDAVVTTVAARDDTDRQQAATDHHREGAVRVPAAHPAGVQFSAV